MSQPLTVVSSLVNQEYLVNNHRIIDFQRGILQVWSRDIQGRHTECRVLYGAEEAERTDSDCQTCMADRPLNPKTGDAVYCVSVLGTRVAGELSL